MRVSFSKQRGIEEPVVLCCIHALRSTDYTFNSPDSSSLAQGHPVLGVASECLCRTRHPTTNSRRSEEILVAVVSPTPSHSTAGSVSWEHVCPKRSSPPDGLQTALLPRSRPCWVFTASRALGIETYSNLHPVHPKFVLDHA